MTGVFGIPPGEMPVPMVVAKVNLLSVSVCTPLPCVFVAIVARLASIIKIARFTLLDVDGYVFYDIQGRSNGRGVGADLTVGAVGTAVADEGCRV